MRGNNNRHYRRFSIIAIAVAVGGLFANAVFNDRHPDEEPPQPLLNQTQIEQQLATLPSHEISLIEVRTTHEVPAIFVEQIELDFSSLPARPKKAAFFAMVLPLIVRENQRIMAERRLIMGAPDTVPFHLFIKYNVRDDDVNALLKRVDIIPVSLVMAQAAAESGWGTSRFARQGNNLFGMRSYHANARGLEPTGAEGFKVLSFATLGQGMAAYMFNLNTHTAYENFRMVRASMRAIGREPDGKTLSSNLKRYSEEPGEYEILLRRIFDDEDLSDFDGVKLMAHREGD